MSLSLNYKQNCHIGKSREVSILIFFITEKPFIKCIAKFLFQCVVCFIRQVALSKLLQQTICSSHPCCQSILLHLSAIACVICVRQQSEWASVGRKWQIIRGVTVDVIFPLECFALTEGACTHSISLSAVQNSLLLTLLPCYIGSSAKAEEREVERRRYIESNRFLSKQSFAMKTNTHTH